MGERKEKVGLPKFVDWVITLCEFVSIFSISSSFFTLNNGPSTGRLSGSAAVEEEEQTEQWFMRTYFEYWVLSLAAASIAATLAPHLVDSCFDWKWRYFRHPRFIATIQLIKLAGAASNVYYLTRHRGEDRELQFTLKESKEKLASSGILAGCELFIMLRTIFEGYCSKDSQKPTNIRNNPEERGEKWFWVAINLWKDFGIVSSLIQTKELYFLILESPAPILLGVVIMKCKITSQSFMYHFLRLFMVAWGGATLYGSSRIHDVKFVLVHDMVVPLVLAGCELIVAFCEVYGGHVNKKLRRDEDIQQIPFL